MMNQILEVKNLSGGYDDLIIVKDITLGRIIGPSSQFDWEKWCRKKYTFEIDFWNFEI